MMHEEDSIEEHNFFKVLSVAGTTITVERREDD